MDLLTAVINCLICYLNMGIATGLLAGFLLLLRPLLVRTVSPRLRLVLWAVVWGGGYLPAWYALFNTLRILPFTLREWITPRTMESELLYAEDIPSYLPACQGDGTYLLAFPGGGTVEVELKLWAVLLFLAIWLGGVFWAACRFQRGTDQLKGAALQGRMLSWEGPELAGLDVPRPGSRSVKVRLCRDLPTSFLCTDWEREGRRGIPVVYLQEELPRERMALVLRHELNHQALHHPRLKQIATLALLLHWWNPILWLAHKYLCLDLELDCDRATMKQLTAREREEYAKTLVELGAGKQLWDVPLAFGESDGAKRVKALLRWHPEQTGWAVFVLVFLLLVGGPKDRFLPRDVYLGMERQFGSMAAQVQAVENALSSGASILEGWWELEDEEDGWVEAAYRLSDGRWVDAIWIKYRGEWHFDLSRRSVAPDLTEYRQFYPEG